MLTYLKYSRPDTEQAFVTVLLADGAFKDIRQPDRFLEGTVELQQG